jgi:hypothetical protein
MSRQEMPDKKWCKLIRIKKGKAMPLQAWTALRVPGG